MTISYFPFDTGAGTNVREHQWSKMARLWRVDGIIETDSDNFEVTRQDGNLMTVNIGAGEAWIKGFYFSSDATETLALNASDPTNPRYDLIVLEINWNTDTCQLTKITGTPAASPSVPTPTQTDEVLWQYPLASVLVDATVTTIAAGKITDLRAFSAPVAVTSTAVNDLIFGTGAGWVTKTLAEAVAIFNTAQKLDTFQILVGAGNLITDGASGYCDTGEMVRTPINSRLHRVNKFEKGEVGFAELPFNPSAWNLGTVTAKIKHYDVGGNVINNCDVAWDAATNVTCTADTSVKLEGTASAKCAVALGATTGALQYVSISQDLRGAKYFSFWVRVSVSVNAGDLYLFIYQPTPGYKSYSLPAIAANTWTKVSIAAGDVSAYSLATQFGIGMAVDKGAFDIYIDQACWQGAVTWVIGGYVLSSGDDIDSAVSFTEQEITGNVKFYEDSVLTFPTLTIANTPTDGDRIMLRITRKNNASDTHGTGKACFAGAELIMTR